MTSRARDAAVLLGRGRFGAWRAYRRLRRSGEFDDAYYTERYPDVAAGGVSPLLHYVLHGGREGRFPSAAAANREREVDRLAHLGHRAFVGGLWDEMGLLQFEFLVAQGLRPEHVLLDIACGALRGGRHAVAYLDPGNYLGLDQHQGLLDAGLAELGPELVAAKRPQLVADSDFGFHRFGRTPDFALAQSLFSHLSEDDILRCLGRLRPCVQPATRFFATYNEGSSDRNPALSASDSYFLYEPPELTELARRTGWRATRIGDWGHPRDQKMMLFEPAAA